MSRAPARQGSKGSVTTPKGSGKGGSGKGNAARRSNSSPAVAGGGSRQGSPGGLGGEMASISQYSDMSPIPMSSVDPRDLKENRGRIFQNKTTQMWVHEASRRAALNELKEGKKPSSYGNAQRMNAKAQSAPAGKRMRGKKTFEESPQRSNNVADTIFCDRDDGGPILAPKRVQPGAMDTTMDATGAPGDVQQVFGEAAGDRSWKLTPAGKHPTNGVGYGHYESQRDPNFDPHAPQKREKRAVPTAADGSITEMWGNSAGVATWSETPRRGRKQTNEPGEQLLKKEGVRTYRAAPGNFSQVDDAVFGGKFAEESDFKRTYDQRNSQKDEESPGSFRGNFSHAAGVKTWKTKDDPLKLDRKQGPGVNPQFVSQLFNEMTDADLKPFRDMFTESAGRATWENRGNALHGGLTDQPTIAAKKMKITTPRARSGSLPAGMTFKADDSFYFTSKNSVGKHFQMTADQRDKMRLDILSATDHLPLHNLIDPQPVFDDAMCKKLECSRRKAGTYETWQGDSLHPNPYVRLHAGAAGDRTWNKPSGNIDMGSGKNHSLQHTSRKDLLTHNSTPRRRSQSQEPRRRSQSEEPRHNKLHLCQHAVTSVGPLVFGQKEVDRWGQGLKDTYHGAAGSATWRDYNKETPRSKVQTVPLWQTPFDPSYAGTRSDKAAREFMGEISASRGTQRHIHDTVPDTPFAGTRKKDKGGFHY